MYQIRKFTVAPSIPAAIQGLRELALNLWWTWNNDAVALFDRLDRHLWNEVEHNPIRLLAELPQAKLEKAANDPGYQAHLERVLESLKTYMAAKTWYDSVYAADFRRPDGQPRTIAYFSMEFGLHECLPLYSGGLGVLAGDHMKSASDLGLPLVGMGLFYHQGYFRQFLSNDGWQFEDYTTANLHELTLTIVRDEKKDEPLKVVFPVGERAVRAQVLAIRVGRNQLFMLDTNLEENHNDDRALTMRLYGGDQEHRIRQEVVLGFGGSRALRAMGYDPDVFHMNEGHSAFLALDQIRERVVNQKLSPAEAREAVAGSTIFTTHTPVPAGIDTFPPGLVAKYLEPYAAEMRMDIREIIRLGQTHPSGDEPFSMATLALNLSRQANGVSQVHGRVAREMWQANWANVPTEEVPITSVTNGVHMHSWLSVDVQRLLERYLGPDWAAVPDDPNLWERVSEIPDAELWLAHERCRERLVVEARAQLKAQYISRGAPPSRITEAEEVLNPEALTIGFARRFAPYKRATLLLSDEERLMQLLTSTDRPVQFIFAGKAHPRDNMGKELIKRIVQFARETGIRKRIIFLENYNMGIARFLVQGVDVWMNNPTKPLEASGTSGMKVTPNGGINFSVLDGWWPEAYDGSNGWAIGDHRTYDNADYQDFVESQSIYDILEREIVPDFYDRGSDGLPRRWIARMKASMRTCAPRFSAMRMVREYADRLYVPAMRSSIHLQENKFAAARSLASWRQRLQKQWKDVAVKSFDTVDAGERVVGSRLQVKALVGLGDVQPTEVVVQLYHGPIPVDGIIDQGQVVPMKCSGSKVEGAWEFAGAVPCTHSGQYGFSVRVIPRHPDLAGQYDLHHIKWA